MLSRQSVGTHQGNELTRNSSESIRSQTSHLREPLWTYSSPKRLKLVRQLTYPLKKKKRRRRKKRRLEMIRRTFLHNPRKRGPVTQTLNDA